MQIIKNKYNEIRFGWKIVCVLVTFLILTALLTTVFSLVYSIYSVVSSGISDSAVITNNFLNNKILITIVSIIQDLCMIFSVVLFWKLFDKKPLSDMGLSSIKQGASDLLLGLIFGAVSITIVFFVFLLTGQITVTGNFRTPNITWTVLLDLVLMIFVGFGEEMFSRGYCMTVMNHCSDIVVFIVPNAIFALMHILNDDVGILPLFNIFLIGLLFSFMFKIRGNIWMPIGYHITWNYFQGSVFGLPVSGNKSAGLYTSKLVEYNILNGGGFGPEGGLVVTAIIILSIALFAVYAKKKTEITSETESKITAKT